MSEEKSKNKVDIKFWFPYLGTILIGFGVLKVIYFYSFFKFDVSSYLDITEYLLLFTKDLLTIIISLVLWIGMYLSILFLSNSNWLDSTIKTLDIYFNNKNKNYISLNILIMSLIIGYGIFWDTFFDGDKYKILMCVFNLVLSVIITTLILKTHANSYIYKNAILVVVFTIHSVILNSTTDYISIRYNKKYKGTIIKTSDTMIVSNSTLYYIGKTRNFVFLNNEKDSSVTVIPMSEVKELKIKSK